MGLWILFNALYDPSIVFTIPIGSSLVACEIFSESIAGILRIIKVKALYTNKSKGALD